MTGNKTGNLGTIERDEGRRVGDADGGEKKSGSAAGMDT